MLLVGQQLAVLEQVLHKVDLVEADMVVDMGMAVGMTGHLVEGMLDKPHQQNQFQAVHL